MSTCTPSCSSITTSTPSYSFIDKEERQIDKSHNTTVARTQPTMDHETTSASTVAILLKLWTRSASTSMTSAELAQKNEMNLPTAEMTSFMATKMMVVE